ncbi:MAG: dTDP-glucose 4,6-dehydratase [Chloroflexota bacterium]
MKLVVTGGAGFIGSHFVHLILESRSDVSVTVLDALTYAGNPANLEDLVDHPRYAFVHGNIADPALVDQVVAGQDAVVNFAAETHVDRSILDAGGFIRTDVEGTWVLLDAARRHGVSRYLQVSTDEVYGEVLSGASREDDPLEPRSPYAASKAGGDLMVRAYGVTHGLPVLITRGANTIGPNQYPEKVVPLFTTNAIDNLPLPIYGDGGALRDYIDVADHCSAIATVLERGEPGQIYNIGAGHAINTLQVADSILSILGKPDSLKKYVPDRPGHDRRYSVDASKTEALGWAPQRDFVAAMERTVRWYAEHESWWRPLKDASFQEYYRQNYTSREEAAAS